MIWTSSESPSVASTTDLEREEGPGPARRASRSFRPAASEPERFLFLFPPFFFLLPFVAVAVLVVATEGAVEVPSEPTAEAPSPDSEYAP